MSEGVHIRWFESCDGASVPLVGGKCSSLGELIRAGVDVPCGFALTTDAHRTFMARAGISHDAAALAEQADLHDAAAVADATARIRALFEDAPMPAEIDDEIRTAYAQLADRCGRGDAAVAVRSSATAEDHHAASFAGQLETYLWIQGADAVLQHVLRCWSALFEPHTVAYCKQVGVEYEDMAMSVGVQQMIDARTAGVMFTINPINGDPSKIVLEGCWGLGEGVVTGEIDSDRFTVDKVTLDILARHHGNKTEAYHYDPQARSVRRLPVAEAEVHAASCSDDEVVQLARLGKGIERHYGRPMDIEWAIGRSAGVVDGPMQFFILQARPETVASQLRAETKAEAPRSALDAVIGGLVARRGR